MLSISLKMVGKIYFDFSFFCIPFGCLHNGRLAHYPHEWKIKISIILFDRLPCRKTLEPFPIYHSSSNCLNIALFTPSVSSLSLARPSHFQYFKMTAEIWPVMMFDFQQGATWICQKVGRLLQSMMIGYWWTLNERSSLEWSWRLMKRITSNLQKLRLFCNLIRCQ